MNYKRVSYAVARLWDFARPKPPQEAPMPSTKYTPAQLVQDINATLQRLRCARANGHQDEAHIAECRLNWLLDKLERK